MTPPETAAIKPEAKPGKATAKTRAACARIDQAERTRREQALTDKWIRDRLVDWRDSCWRCRRPIVPGQLWTAVSNGETVVHFHRPCHAEWLVPQQVAARRALGLNRNRRLNLAAKNFAPCRRIEERRKGHDETDVQRGRREPPSHD
jgi:hypothetical protein